MHSPSPYLNYVDEFDGGLIAPLKLAPRAHLDVLAVAVTIVVMANLAPPFAPAIDASVRAARSLRLHCAKCRLFRSILRAIVNTRLSP